MVRVQNPRAGINQAAGALARAVRSPMGRPKGMGSQRVYDELRGQILSLRLPPGDDIDEPAIVKALGVSRTPVREALIKLQADGLVEISPNRGARVAPIPFESIHELFEALELCQRAIARLACSRHDAASLAEAAHWSKDFAAAAHAEDYSRMSEANRRYHIALGAASGNRYLADAQARLLDASLRLAHITLATAPQHYVLYKEYYNRVIDEHEKLIDLIEKRDMSGAEILAGEHARLFQRRVAEFVSKSNTDRIRLDFLTDDASKPSDSAERRDRKARPARAAKTSPGAAG